MGIIGGLFALGIVVFFIYSMWRVYEKAGEPGWAAIVPIYNLIVLLKIAGKPAWWVIMFLIPIVNIIFLVMTYVAFAKAFGKDTGFAIGLIFLSFIFIPMMAFDDSIQYVGNKEIGLEDHIIE